MSGNEQMIRGSCLCGGVKFKVEGPFTDVLHCHCTMCQKAQGAAFRSRAGVRAANFHWIVGQELITYYESSPGNHRGFCKVCGSPIHSKFDDHPEVYGFPLGTLDDDPGVKPAFHVFVGNKAPWHDSTDDLPQFAELPAD
jgi:hypothetical protein